MFSHVTAGKWFREIRAQNSYEKFKLLNATPGPKCPFLIRNFFRYDLLPFGEHELKLTGPFLKKSFSLAAKKPWEFDLPFTNGISCFIKINKIIINKWNIFFYLDEFFCFLLYSSVTFGFSLKIRLSCFHFWTGSPSVGYLISLYKFYELYKAHLLLIE